MTPASRFSHRDRFLAAVRQQPLIMGILNVTPDSFSDGGQHAGLERALAHAGVMVAGGAAVIDIGGESTRPGAVPVPEDEELRRVLPVLKAIHAQHDLPVSIDSWKAAVARAATGQGAAIINDVWGLQKDPAMADTVAETGSAVIIMHNRTSIDAEIDIIDDMQRFFERSLALAARAGIPDSHILLDPGVGFGKTVEQNLACVWQLDRLAGYGLPLLLGVSRKSFIGKVLGKGFDRTVDDRLAGSLAAAMIGLMRGAAVLRVHDVAEHADALAIFRAARDAAKGASP
jgi:dihydropteroate synthase